MGQPNLLARPLGWNSGGEGGREGRGGGIADSRRSLGWRLGVRHAVGAMGSWALAGTRRLYRWEGAQSTLRLMHTGVCEIVGGSTVDWRYDVLGQSWDEGEGDQDDFSRVTVRGPPKSSNHSGISSSWPGTPSF